MSDRGLHARSRDRAGRTGLAQCFLGQAIGAFLVGRAVPLGCFAAFAAFAAWDVGHRTAAGFVADATAGFTGVAALPVGLTAVRGSGGYRRLVCDMNLVEAND